MKHAQVGTYFWNVWVVKDGRRTFHQSYFTYDSAARDAASIPGAKIERSE